MNSSYQGIDDPVICMKCHKRVSVINIDGHCEDCMDQTPFNTAKGAK
jgi:hypothetical protein